MRVLLTGPNGYIGRRLKYKLLEDSSLSLRLLVRNKKTVSGQHSSVRDVVEGNTFDKDSLRVALDGIDVAYYFVHALNAGKNFRNADNESAQNFLDICIEKGVKRIIYLGGLGEDNTASEHLISRIEVGRILSSRPDVVPCIWIRAGMVVGSGSASFEILRNLVQKLPYMITPKWVNTRAQSIAVSDAIRYLDDARKLDVEGNLVVDIGSDIMTYRSMLERTSEIMGLKRRLIPVPILSPKISSYWLMMLTPVPYSVASSLVEGLKSEVVQLNDNADKYFDFKPMSFDESVRIALDEIVKNQVISRWSDATDGDIWERDHKKDIANALFIDRRDVALSDVPRDKVYESFKRVGGEEGWFSYNMLWKVGGAIDKLFGGAGTNRGRRDACDLRIGDCLDFWKVVDLVPNERLLLFAQNNAPGDSWLEFKIEGNHYIQTAYFYPKGLLGRLYWYVMMPLHYFIFNDMSEQIVSRARKL